MSTDGDDRAGAPTGATWSLYLLECADGSFYTGIATDVERRFREHQAGKGARYTRARKAVALLAARAVGSRSQALQAEIAIKRLPKTAKLAAVLALPDLAAEAA